MTRYVLQRLLLTIPVIVGVGILVFFLVRLTGDPAVLMLGPGSPPEALEAFRQERGLDGPLWSQFLTFAADALHGDLGASVRENRPAVDVVLERLPATLQLAGAALLLAVGVGVPLGVVAAVRSGTALGRAIFLLTTVSQGVPIFYAGLMLQLVLGARLQIFPTSGSGEWRYLALPALSLSVYFTAVVARVMRTSMLEQLPSAYLLTAKAKGMSRLRLLSRHAARNALIPVVSVLGLQFGSLLGGAVITESIFGWPGIGRLAVTAISGRDFPVVQAIVLLSVIVFLVVNLLVDIVYARLDPRIKYGR